MRDIAVTQRVMIPTIKIPNWNNSEYVTMAPPPFGSEDVYKRQHQRKTQLHERPRHKKTGCENIYDHAQRPFPKGPDARCENRAAQILKITIKAQKTMQLGMISQELQTHEARITNS